MGHAWDARRVSANSRSSERGQTCPPTDRPPPAHGGSCCAASSLVGPVLTVSDPSDIGHRRRIPGRRVENSAFNRPVGVRPADRPAFDRANIEFNWRRAHWGRGARPTRNLRAPPKSM